MTIKTLKYILLTETDQVYDSIYCVRSRPLWNQAIYNNKASRSCYIYAQMVTNDSVFISNRSIHNTFYCCSSCSSCNNSCYNYFITTYFKSCLNTSQIVSWTNLSTIQYPTNYYTANNNLIHGKQNNYWYGIPVMANSEMFDFWQLLHDINIHSQKRVFKRGVSKPETSISTYFQEFSWFYISFVTSYYCHRNFLQLWKPKRRPVKRILNQGRLWSLFEFVNLIYIWKNIFQINPQSKSTTLQTTPFLKNTRSSSTADSSGTLIAGVTVGAVVLIVILVAILIVRVMRRRRRLGSTSLFQRNRK